MLLLFKAVGVLSGAVAGDPEVTQRAVVPQGPAVGHEGWRVPQGAAAGDPRPLLLRDTPYRERESSGIEFI